MTMMPLQAKPGLICVQTTLDDPQSAANFAQALVTQKLAACVQITAIRSFYVWQGQAEDAAEQLLTIKTARDQLDALARYVADNHPYDEPEFLVLPVDAASAGYAAWVAGSVA